MAKKKPTYVVVGDSVVDGKTKGDTITIEDPVRARQLIRGGHIEAT